MMHSHSACAARQAPPTTLPARVAALARTSWRAFWMWRARHATVQILHTLDARTLHDIGINPGEIESFVWSEDCGRRRGYDEAWRARSGM